MQGESGRVSAPRETLLWVERKSHNQEAVASCTENTNTMGKQREKQSMTGDDETMLLGALGTSWALTGVIALD